LTREEHLKFCKICTHQKFDSKQGIVCGLTNRIADFQENCKDFNQDSVIKEKLELKSAQAELNNLASQGQRLTNYLIDLVIILLLSVVYGIFLGVFLLVIDAPELLFYLEQDNRLVDYLIGFICGMCYYTFFESLFGRTPAKYITHTLVVDNQGNKPSFNTILLRSLCRHIPFNALSFLGDSGTGWHDKLSKTRVIKV